MVVEIFFHLLLQLLRTREKKLGCGFCIIGWVGPNVTSMCCICHIAPNFNKVFKNVDLKKQVINMGKLLSVTPHFS